MLVGEGEVSFFLQRQRHIFGFSIAEVFKPSATAFTMLFPPELYINVSNINTTMFRTQSWGGLNIAGNCKIPCNWVIGRHFPFLVVFLFLFLKKRGIPLFLSWHFHALLSQNNTKCCKIARIIKKNLQVLEIFHYSVHTWFLDITKGNIN